MTPHRQLLADYADSGSEEAFRQLVEAYIGLVHGTALRLVHGDQHLAEDIAQTAFTDLARKAKTLSPDILIGGWLHQRACYAAANVLRSERRRMIREREAVEMNTVNADEALAWAAPVLDEAISQLPPEDRHAIVLRFFERWNFRAIGESLGTTEDAAQKRVGRALEKLRGLLARRGVVLSATVLALALGNVAATAAPVGLAGAISTAALANAHAGAGFTMTTLKFMAMTKVKMITIAACVGLVVAGTVTTVVVERDPSYTPPAHPNPTQILYGAQQDVTAGRYKVALSKFIWYRDNALRYDSSLVGVRNSFALSWWGELAEKYPPAMKKLKAIRDNAIDELHKNKADANTSYLIASSINLGLKEQQKDIDLFKWLDQHNPAVARQVYSLVEMDLIHAGEYALCGRYLDADKSYRGILDGYDRIMGMHHAQNFHQLQDFAEKHFSNQTATLVALLAINGHAEDAQRIARQASETLKKPEFAAILTEAENGTVPPAWP